jgi:hypothetical protein
MNQTLTIVSSTRLQTTPQTAWSTTATSTLLAAAVNTTSTAAPCSAMLPPAWQLLQQILLQASLDFLRGAEWLTSNVPDGWKAKQVTWAPWLKPMHT